MGYLGPDGHPAGFIVEALAEASVRAGIRIEWAPPADAQAHDAALRQGTVDLVVGSASGNRAREFWVSSPFWASELTVLVPADAGIRRDDQVRGRRLAIPEAASVELRSYFSPGAVVPVGSAPAVEDAVCAGRADAGVVATMYLRELLSTRTPACARVTLTAFDSSAHLEYVLVGRSAVAKDGQRLRDALDEITADGTLGAIAQRHPPVSAPYAASMAALLAARYDRRLMFITMASAGLLILLGVVHVALQARSKRQLREVNARLQEDIRRREAAERESQLLHAELLQAQKMESIGRLAGGVAHDFNNILTVQKGYCEMLRMDLPPSHPMAMPLAEIDACADRAAALTRQLLAFSRRQTLQPQVLDLNELVGRLLTMLRRLIGEDVVLEWQPAPRPAMIKADAGQIEQVVVNLAVNARDAMAQGGRLRLRVSFLDEETERPFDLAPGPHVRLTMADSGSGMDEETKRRLFEPFFTTKAAGAGTGLGLATVYGIVRQSGGAITVDSEPGEGTSFNVFLPLVSEPASEVQAVDVSVPRGQGQLVLIVEDEASLRHLTAAAVERLGYRVRAEAGGSAALRRVESERLRPDLLLTDVVMPDMSGPALVQHLRARLPSLRVLYMSGYTNHGLSEAELGGAWTGFVQKPFALSELGERIGEMLAR